MTEFREIREKIIPLINEGLETNEIVKKLNCNRMAVRDAKREVRDRNRMTEFQNRYSLRVARLLFWNHIENENDWRKAVNSGEYLRFKKFGAKAFEEVESKCEIGRNEDGKNTDSDDQSGRV